jgi:hypothetical protein
MAFCNSCGATLNPGTKFCNKCGAAVSGAVATPSPAPLAPPPSTGSSSAVKIILIVVAVIVVIGILGLVSLGVIAHRVARSVHVSQNGNAVKMETPFGKVETNKDPEQAARDLGVDIYPGAQIQPNGSATTTFGGIHTVAAVLESSDSVDKICSFYKSRFPNAMVTTSGTNRCTLISGDQKNMITINIENSGDNTKLQITNVMKPSGSSN